MLFSNLLGGLPSGGPDEDRPFNRAPIIDQLGGNGPILFRSRERSGWSVLTGSPGRSKGSSPSAPDSWPNGPTAFEGDLEAHARPAEPDLTLQPVWNLPLGEKGLKRDTEGGVLERDRKLDALRLMSGDR